MESASCTIRDFTSPDLPHKIFISSLQDTSNLLRTHLMRHCQDSESGQNSCSVVVVAAARAAPVHIRQAHNHSRCEPKHILAA